MLMGRTDRGTVFGWLRIQGDTASPLKSLPQAQRAVGIKWPIGAGRATTVHLSPDRSPRHPIMQRRQVGVAMKTFGLLLVFFGGLLGTPILAQEQRPTRPTVEFKEGQPFPDLVLPALEDGRPVSLAQFRGKKVILHIFASW